MNSPANLFTVVFYVVLFFALNNYLYVICGEHATYGLNSPANLFTVVFYFVFVVPIHMNVIASRLATVLRTVLAVVLAKWF